MNAENRKHRIEAIRVLLETYRDAFEAVSSGDGVPGTDDSTLKWHELASCGDYREGSYGELEDVLRRLKARAPSLYWHVAERFLRSKRVVRVLRKDGFGRWFDVGQNERVVCSLAVTQHGRGRHRAVIEHWDAGVDTRIVDQALALMERIWRGEPRLPAAYYAAVNPNPVADAA